MKANRVFSGQVLLLALLVSACAGGDRAPVAPRLPVRPAPPRPAPVRIAPAPSPPASSDWRDAPLAPGAWRLAGSGLAEFGPALASAAAPMTAHAAPIARLRCQVPRQSMILEWIFANGAYADDSGSVPAVIATTSLTRVVEALRSGGRVTLAFSVYDPLLDAMAFSRGRFMIEVPGRGRLILPAWPEVARAIEDCRQDNASVDSARNVRF